MKKQFLLCLVIATLVSLLSCNDKNDEFTDSGRSTILSLDGPNAAYMGDSISFTFEAQGHKVQLATSKISILYGEEIVSERIIITGANGTYSGKVYIPLLKNVSDGDAIVRLRVQNERFASDVKELNIAVTRPTYPKLTLRTADKDYDMLSVAGEKHKYAVTDEFPTEVLANIILPKFGENGNEITFGSVDGKIASSVPDKIEFTSDTEGRYEISFNTFTFVGHPFIKFAVNDIEFVKVDDAQFKVETEFTQGEEIQITGLKDDYPNYWVDPVFFDIKKNTDGKILIFKGRTDKYRLTVNKVLKYFNVELMNGDKLSTIGNGEGAIWVIGGGNIGKPSYAKNGIGWTPNKGFCTSPIGNGKHQVILKAGEQVPTKSGDIDFKFFGQRDWGFEFNAGRISLATPNPWFRVDSGSNGNIKGNGTDLTAGKYYVLTVDISTGINSATLSVEELDSIPEVE